LAAICSLAAMTAHAIEEGKALELSTFVYLMEMGQLELMHAEDALTSDPSDS
jgi:hypothetical protein